MNTRSLVAVTLIAGVLFSALFATGGVGAFDFWTWMAFNAVVLWGLSVWMDRSFLPHLRANAGLGLWTTLAWGVVSAALLYGIFYMGNIAARALWGDAAVSGIRAVYDFKSGISPWRVLLSIACLIGPVEELFWRGLIQRQLAARRGPWAGFVLATLLYGGVHLPGGNLMLVLAALVCGAFWGALYLWKRSAWINVISHVLWDLTVFLWLPFR